MLPKSTTFAPTYQYRDPTHAELPHVVKFSGGRSSAMMLFETACAGLLRAERGDVAIFNNTSAEHPATYQFVAECKARLEADHGIPLMLVEFCTVEDSVHGEWKRVPTFRLVNDRPYSADNPHGYRHQGEVFRELTSFKAFLPNQFRRVCTSGLKLEPTRRFLKMWLGGRPTLPAAGVCVEGSVVDRAYSYRTYRMRGGASPEPLYNSKRAYALSRPTFRAKQAYADFSAVYAPHRNERVYESVYGGRARIGRGVDYVSLIGFRADEAGRVKAVRARSSNPHGRSDEVGEIVYMPLADAGVESEDVAEFWDAQDFDLALDPSANLGNCTFCFLKGPAALRSVRDTIRAGGTALAGTPMDIGWWVELEREYGRDLDAENSERINPKSPSRIGFFGANGLNYEVIEQATEDARLPDWAAQPCVCVN